MRTKSEWKAYHENSKEQLKKYEETDPRNKVFLSAKKSQIQKVKEKLPMLNSKAEGDLFNALMSGDRSFATISEDFDEWSIYFLAHKVSSFRCRSFYVCKMISFARFPPERVNQFD